MKRITEKLILTLVAIMMVLPGAFAQVDVDESFLMVNTDGARSMFVEGGNWKITFSNVDSLGQGYDAPVNIVFEGALYNEKDTICIETIDSLGFKLPDDDMKPGVYEITEEEFKYIVSCDTVPTIEFRIDCLGKIKMPSVGQKVICNIFREPMQGGVVGKVQDMRLDYEKGVVRMTLKRIELHEVYDVFYKSILDTDMQYAPEVPEEAVQTRSVVKYDLKNSETRAGISDDASYALYMLDDFSITFEKPEDTNKIVAHFIVNGAYSVTPTGYIIVDNTKYSVGGVMPEDKEATDFNFTLDVSCNVTLVYEHYGKATKTIDWWMKDNKPVKSVHLGYGIFFNVYLGALLEFTLDANLRIPSAANFSFSVGAKRTNGIIKPTFEIGTNKLVPDGIMAPELDTSYVFVDGRVFAAFQTKLGIGILYDVFELLGNFGIGVRVGGRVTYMSGQFSDTYCDWRTWLDSREVFYLGINDGNHFTVDLGFIHDGITSYRDITEAELPEPGEDVSLDDLAPKKEKKFSEVFGYDPKSFIELYRLNAAPDTREISERSFDEETYRYKGVLKNEHDIVFTYFTDMLFLDPDKMDDDDIEYMAVQLGKFNSLDDNDVKFDIDLSGKRDIRGRRLDVYPMIYNSLYTGYMIMGKFDQIYLPYQVKLKRVEKDYDHCFIEAEFDVEALQNSNMKESGLVLYKRFTDEVLYKLPFEVNKLTTNNIAVTLSRSDYSEEEFAVAAYLYDGVTGRYMYSERKDAGFKDYYRPDTKDATDITAVGATLHGRVHDVVRDAETTLDLPSKFNVGFLYTPGSVEKTTPLKNFYINPGNIDNNFEIDFPSDFEPETEYRYLAVLIDNERNVKFLGEELKFKTKPAFHDLMAEVSIDRVDIQVFVDNAFVGVTNKSKYKFYVSEHKDVWEKLGYVVKDEEMENREEYPDYAVLVREISVTADDFLYDEETKDYDLGIDSEKGWVPGRTYYAKVVYDDGLRKRVESDVIEFTIPAPIDNLIAVPEADEAKMFADVYFTYAKDNSEITLMYYAKENEGHDEIVSEFPASKVAKWKNKDNYIVGMEFVLPNLEPQTEYIYWYILERTIDGVTTTYESRKETFTTKKLEYKVTLDTPVVENNTANLKGRVNQILYGLLEKSLGDIPDEVRKQFMVYFEVSRYSNMKEPTVIYREFGDEREWEVELTDLAWNTKFYCRLVTETADGLKTFKSSTKSFTIGPEPSENFTVQTFDAVLDDEWTTLKGKVNSTVLEALEAGIYGEMLFGFEYAPTKSDLENGTDNVLRDSDVALSKSTGLFTKSLQLKPNTQYYCRAFVYVAGRFVYGNIVDFKTADYDAGLIVPDLEAGRRRELKALELDESLIKDVIFFEKGKMIVPTDKELKLLIETEPYEKINE